MVRKGRVNIGRFITIMITFKKHDLLRPTSQRNNPLCPLLECVCVWVWTCVCVHAQVESLSISLLS